MIKTKVNLKQFSHFKTFSLNFIKFNILMLRSGMKNYIILHVTDKQRFLAVIKITGGR